MIFDAPSMETRVVNFRTVPFHCYFTLTCAGLFPLRRDGSSSSSWFLTGFKGPRLTTIQERMVEQGGWGAL